MKTYRAPPPHFPRQTITSRLRGYEAAFYAIQPTFHDPDLKPYRYNGESEIRRVHAASVQAIRELCIC
jgi:hypothetical protein